MASFDPDRRRMTEDDIVFPNNSSAVVVDDETTAQSEASGRFRIRCWHPVDGTGDDWRSVIVDFADLTIDTAGQRVFLVDVAGEAAAQRLRAKAEAATRLAEAEAEALARDEALRDRFKAYWSALWPKGGPDARFAAWATFGAEFRARGLGLPLHGSEGDLERWLRLIMTARTGAPAGWRHSALPEVAHYLHDKHPGLLQTFFRVLRHTDDTKP